MSSGVTVRARLSCWPALKIWLPEPITTLPLLWSITVLLLPKVSAPSTLPPTEIDGPLGAGAGCEAGFVFLRAMRITPFERHLIRLRLPFYTANKEINEILPELGDASRDLSVDNLRQALDF